MLGIDTETQPTYVPRHMLPEPHPTALIQIASRSHGGEEKVFLVDMLVLSEQKECMAQLDALLGAVLSDDKCLKLGQGLARDIKELAQAYPDLLCFRFVRSIVETHALARYLVPSTHQPPSLKNLVAEYMHYTLRKDQQMSNWGHRPLNHAQRQYAACDALVLLRLFDAM
ncbi:ribonuclease H-like domain-containing protein, partial [Ochromonadaceae sp. CCMP2298]